MKKSFKYLFSLLLIIPFVFAVTACGGSAPGLDNEERLKLVIENTSKAIVSVDDKIMEEHEKEANNPSGQVLTASPMGDLPENNKHTMMDRSANEQAYIPITQMTISFGYYALSEYFLKYLPFFLNKTLAIEQTYYPSQQIWVKSCLSESTMELNIWTEYGSAFEEYINITINFNKNTLKPTKFTHRENRHWLAKEGDDFGFIQVDFETSDCVIETIKYGTSSNINYANASEDTIKANIQRYIREEFNFANYKNKVTKTYLGTEHNLTDQQMIAYATNFDYVYSRNNKEKFDFANATQFQYGDNAMDFAFDKYLISEDKTTGKLTRVRAN